MTNTKLLTKNFYGTEDVPTILFPDVIPCLWLSFVDTTRTRINLKENTRVILNLKKV